MAFRAGFSPDVLWAARERQLSREKPVASQRSGDSDWIIVNQDFNANGLEGNFARRLSDDKRFAGSIKFWNELHTTGNLAPTGTNSQDGGIA